MEGWHASKRMRILPRMSTNAFRPVFTTEQKRAQCKIIWLSDSCSAEALRQAGRLDESIGFVANARGLGIRVAAEDFEECGMTILGEQETHKLVGDLWELSGAPMSWDHNSVAQVLWDANLAANAVTRFVKGAYRTLILRFAKGQQPDRNLIHA